MGRGIAERGWSANLGAARRARNGLTLGFVPREKRQQRAFGVAPVQKIKRALDVVTLDRSAERGGDLGDAAAHRLGAGEAHVLDAGAQRRERRAGLVGTI